MLLKLAVLVDIISDLFRGPSLILRHILDVLYVLTWVEHAFRLKVCKGLNVFLKRLNSSFHFLV